MKKLSILFLSVLALGMTVVSCSKDDDNEAAASIEGKWNVSKMSITGLGLPAQEIDNPENAPGCNKNYLEIKTGGVAIEGTYEGTACKLSTVTGTWVKDGNKITIKLGADTEVFDVVSVTSSGMTLGTTYTESGITMTVNTIFTR
jgi:hypothetical protein